MMSTEIYENFNKAGKTSYEAIKELYAVNNNFLEQLMEQQFALASLGIEYTTRQMKLASTAKGYKELLSGETDIAGDISSKVQGIARNTLDIFNESRDEVGAWFEKNVKEAEKSFKDVAKVVPVATTSKAA